MSRQIDEETMTRFKITLEMPVDISKLNISESTDDTISMKDHSKWLREIKHNSSFEDMRADIISEKVKPYCAPGECKVFDNTIVTHCDAFHCDEVFATAILLFIDERLNIHRTRDVEEIARFVEEDCNSYIVDVGKEYHPTTRQFDHHQKKVVDHFDDKKDIPLSSCGMVYKYMGKDAIQIISPTKDLLDDETLENIYHKVYHGLIESIDANDTGVDYIKDEHRNKPIYNYNTLPTLPTIIGAYNLKDTQDHKGQMEAFKQAVVLATTIFEHTVVNTINNHLSYIENKEMMMKIINEPLIKGTIVVKNDNIYVEGFLRELDPSQKVIFFIDYNEKKDEWKVRTRRKNNKGYGFVAPLISEKEAKTDPEVVFVHQALFLGSTKTLDSAINLAHRSYDQFMGNE